MARFYSNENFPLRTVVELRALGHDVLTSYEAGQANQKIPDEKVLEFAVSMSRAVVTINRTDFHRLHRLVAGQHAGIVTCTDDRDMIALARRIHAAIAGLVDLNGRLIKVVRPTSSPTSP